MFVDSLVKGHESDLSPVLRGFLEIAHAEPPLTADELLNAWAECDVIRGKLLQQMQEYPVLLCPVCSIPAFRHGERKWKVDGQEVEYLDVMRYTQWFNLLAAPGSRGAGWAVARGIADRRPESWPVRSKMRLRWRWRRSSTANSDSLFLRSHRRHREADSDLFSTLASTPPAAPCWAKLFGTYGAGFLRNRSTVPTQNQFSHML